MAKEAKYRDESWLREQYIEKSLTGHEIAERCDSSKRTVYRWLDRFDIETRRDGGSRELSYPQLADSEWVREQYIDEEKSCADIAAEIGCSKSNVQSWIDKHDINTDAFRKETVECLKNKDWLREEYIEKSKTGYEIAEECGCCTTTVYKWIRQHNINPQYNGKVSGDEHWWYSGGSKPYGYGWNRRKRRSVRERDNRTCQDPQCSVTQVEHLDQYGEKLHVHHLRKARNVEEPEERNAKNNLITLCRDCHRQWEKIADAGLVPELVAVD